MSLKNRAMAGLLALVVAVTLAACGDDDPSDTPDVTETTEPVGS
jgi:predicted small lipoprotein YifL